MAFVLPSPLPPEVFASVVAFVPADLCMSSGRTQIVTLRALSRHTSEVVLHGLPERLALQEGIKKANLHQNMRMERDALLGAGLHGELRAEAHNRLEELLQFFAAK